MSASLKAMMAAWRHGSLAVRWLWPWRGKRGSAAASWCPDEFDMEENGEEGAAKRAPAAHGQAAALVPVTKGKCCLGLTTARMKARAGARGGGDRGGAIGRWNRRMVVRWRSLTPVGGAMACGGVSSRSAFPN
jgi:hypothetical protein